VSKHFEHATVDLDSARSPSSSAEIAEREALRAPRGTPLYVHLPFCAAKCHYCDFFSVPEQGHDRRATIDAILCEAETRAATHPRTVFFGGGTPSLLSSDELRELFDGLDRITRFRSSAVEVTAECNPESLDETKARVMLEQGVTRLSIGFQSLHDDILRLFGRVHSFDQSFRAYEAARRAGAANVNIDMIYAVPDQTRETWERDLTRVLTLEPDHLSAYNLTFEEDTVFKRWLGEGRIARQPEEVELELFEATRAIAARFGFEAYEISNFAARGRRCAHNVNYWHNGTYVGLGPSAVSKIGNTRAGNVRAISAYNHRARESGRAIVWEETPSPAARLAETWWLALRLSEGIAPEEARRRAGFASEHDPAQAIALRLVELGLLARDGERFTLTPRGLPLADHVARQFLSAVHD
jgi:oxygen-independent coproporphyrinogen-3 oxidase